MESYDIPIVIAVCPAQESLAYMNLLPSLGVKCLPQKNAFAFLRYFHVMWILDYDVSRQDFPGCVPSGVPAAVGSEGTVDAVIAVTKGEIKEVPVYIRKCFLAVSLITS